MMRKGDDAYYLGCKQGFTLIEMMIAVAIIGILAAIALPSYSYFVEKADLAHARTGLVTINQILVREKIKGNLTGAIIQNNTDIALGGVDVGVREKYDIVVRCGSGANPGACAGNNSVSTYFLFAVPNDMTSRTKSLWMSHNGTVYECTVKLSNYLPNTNPSICEISN